MLGNLGAIGVSIFLMISGYLAVALHNEEEYGIKEKIKSGCDCFLNRLKKVYPLHLFTLLLAIPFSCKALFLTFLLETWLILILNTLLIHSYFPIGYFSFNFVSWYLPVFLFASFVSPFISHYFKKRINDNNRLKIAIRLLMVIIITQFLWAWLWLDCSFNHWTIYIFPLVRLLDFILGMNLSLFSEYTNKRKLSNCFLFLGLMINCALIIAVLNKKSEFFSVAIWTLPTFLMLLGLISKDLSSFGKLLFCNKAMVWMGDISFELFLFHQLMIRYTNLVARKFVTSYENSMLVFILAFVLSILLSWIWRRFVNPKLNR